MNPYWTDLQKYKEVELCTMLGNFQGNCPIYIRRYSRDGMTHVLHRHEMIQMNYLIKGSCRHLIGGKEAPVVKGDLLIIPPYIPHLLQCGEDEDFEIYEIEFTPEVIIQSVQDFENLQSIFDFAYLEPFLLSEDQLHSRYHLPAEEQPKAQRLMTELHEEYQTKAPGYMLLCKALLLQLLVLFQRAMSQEAVQAVSRETYSSHIRAMEKAIAYVDENYMKDISAQDVAQAAAFSKSYFGYLFKTVTHKTFVEYLNEKRIEAATLQLADPSKRVIDICYDCGFKNISHFNRTFKAAVGVSPTQYRAALRAEA